MKRIADEQELIADIPPVVKPVVVEDAPLVIAVQHRDVPVVVVHRERAVRPYQEPSIPPPIDSFLSDVFYAEPLAHQLPIPSIFILRKCRRALSYSIPYDILANGQFQISIVRSRGRGQFHLLSKFNYNKKPRPTHVLQGCRDVPNEAK